MGQGYNYIDVRQLSNHWCIVKEQTSWRDNGALLVQSLTRIRKSAVASACASFLFA